MTFAVVKAMLFIAIMNSQKLVIVRFRKITSFQEGNCD